MGFFEICAGCRWLFWHAAELCHPGVEIISEGARQIPNELKGKQPVSRF